MSHLANAGVPLSDPVAGIAAVHGRPAVAELLAVIAGLRGRVPSPAGPPARPRRCRRFAFARGFGFERCLPLGRVLRCGGAVALAVAVAAVAVSGSPGPPVEVLVPQLARAASSTSRSAIHGHERQRGGAAVASSVIDSGAVEDVHLNPAPAGVARLDAGQVHHAVAVLVARDPVEAGSPAPERFPAQPLWMSRLCVNQPDAVCPAAIA
jgi:hypothetical protein